MTVERHPEQDRLAALRRYEVLDTSPEEAFDDLTRLAAHICQAPVALIEFVDETRTFVKSNLGFLVAGGLDRAESFAHAVVMADDLIVVHDTTEDPRFSSLPTVTSPPHFRSFAGAPLRTPDGVIIGALEVLDKTPRGLSADQAAALSVLARQIVTQLELRRAAADATRAAEEQRHLRMALQEAEERFRSLVETIPAVVYLDAFNRDSSAIYIGPQVAELLGYAPQEWYDRPNLWEHVVHPEDRAAAMADQAAAAERSGSWRLEYRMQAKDGRVVWVHDEAVVVEDDAGRPLYWQGIWLDITDRKMAEDQVREAETKYQALIEQLPAITYLDPVAPDAPFLYISPQVETIVGGTVSEWMTQAGFWLSRVHPDDRAGVKNASALTQDLSKGPTVAQEYRMLRDDGSLVWIREEMRLLRSDYGAPWVVQGLMYDITERITAEIALRGALENEQLAVEHLQRLDEIKNTLLHAVSHDLRGPITTMLGSALTLERDQSLPADDQEQLVHSLVSSARKMHRLVNDLLDTDRLERGIVEPKRHIVDLGQLAQRVVEELGYGRDHPITLDAGAVVLAVDSTKVERMMENLLANAVRHTPAGTRVWLRIRPSKEGAEIVVEDDGPGVQAEQREHIFEPFRQGPGSEGHGGIGIGLSLVARFAELHGGRAWVEDRDGGGASFHVYLPDGPAEPVADLSPLFDRPLS